MGPTAPADQSNNDGLVPAQDIQTPHNVDVTRNAATGWGATADSAESTGRRFIVDLFQTAETHAEQFIIHAAGEAEARMEAAEIVASKNLEGVVHRLEIREDLPLATDPNASSGTTEAGPTDDTTKTDAVSLDDSTATTDVAGSTNADATDPAAS